MPACFRNLQNSLVVSMDPDWFSDMHNQMTPFTGTGYRLGDRTDDLAAQSTQPEEDSQSADIPSGQPTQSAQKEDQGDHAPLVPPLLSSSAASSRLATDAGMSAANMNFVSKTRLANLKDVVASWRYALQHGGEAFTIRIDDFLMEVTLELTKPVSLFCAVERLEKEFRRLQSGKIQIDEAQQFQQQEGKAKAEVAATSPDVASMSDDNDPAELCTDDATMADIDDYLNTAGEHPRSSARRPPKLAASGKRKPKPKATRKTTKQKPA